MAKANTRKQEKKASTDNKLKRNVKKEEVEVTEAAPLKEEDTKQETKTTAKTEEKAEVKPAEVPELKTDETEKPKEERKILKESIHIIPLRDAFRMQYTKRARSAVNVIKKYLRKHTRKDNIKISTSLNEKIWKNGIQNVPRKVRVKIEEEEKVATATLP